MRNFNVAKMDTAHKRLTGHSRVFISLILNPNF